MALVISDLAAEVSVPQNGTLSRTLHQDDRIRLVLFAFDKGQEFASVSVGGYVTRIRARLPESADTLDVVMEELLTAHRQEWILVGSGPRNARFVYVDRVVSLPSP